MQSHLGLKALHQIHVLCWSPLHLHFLHTYIILYIHISFDRVIYIILVLFIKCVQPSMTCDSLLPLMYIPKTKKQRITKTTTPQWWHIGRLVVLARSGVQGPGTPRNAFLHQDLRLCIVFFAGFWVAQAAPSFRAFPEASWKSTTSTKNWGKLWKTDEVISRQEAQRTFQEQMDHLIQWWR